MKTLLLFVGFALLVMAALSTPVAIGLGLYDWVVNDMEFKIALWEGFKSWVLIMGVGLVGGVPCYIISQR